MDTIPTHLNELMPPLQQLVVGPGGTVDALDLGHPP